MCLYIAAFRHNAFQSTLGHELAAMLGVPFIPLDELYWNPNWTPTPREQFRTKVERVLAEEKNGWVIDGNYYKRIGPIVQAQATDVICTFSFCRSGSRSDYTFGLLSRARSTLPAVLSAHPRAHIPPSSRPRTAMQPGLSGTPLNGVLLKKKHHLVVSHHSCPSAETRDGEHAVGWRC